MHLGADGSAEAGRLMPVRMLLTVRSADAQHAFAYDSEIRAGGGREQPSKPGRDAGLIRANQSWPQDISCA